MVFHGGFMAKLEQFFAKYQAHSLGEARVSYG